MSSEELAAKKCVPCRGGVPPLKGAKLAGIARHLPPWEVVNEHHLKRRFEFPDFRSALDFTVQVGEVAEQEGHHPDIYLAWGKVEVTVWTHKIDGLTESDFILAAKIDRLYQPPEKKRA
jgi:4a-hydroxytetrahydrobiopterin dehydratase